MTKSQTVAVLSAVSAALVAVAAFFPGFAPFATAAAALLGSPVVAALAEKKQP